MASPKASIKRKRNKLRSEFYGHPWAMHAGALSELGQSIEIGDMESIQASLSMLGEGDDGKTKIVNGVAVIPVNGTLRDGVDFMVKFGGATSYQILERDFKAAQANDSVKSIVFLCNSPGGSAIGCKRVADAIFAARGKKPVTAFVQGQCCSAAYYIAAACDRIEATADSMVGSIGTIMPHIEMAGLLDEIGYGVTVITNADSPKKGHGNQYEKLTPEGKATLQSFIDSYGKPFIADVARYRGTTAESVVENFGKGDSVRADAAISIGMIDAVVAGLSETMDRLTGSAEPSPINATESLPVAAVVASTTPTLPVATGTTQEGKVEMKVSAKVRAQLFACGLIDSMEASDETCQAVMAGFFRGAVPDNETAVLDGLTAKAATSPAVTATEQPSAKEAPQAPAANVAQAHEAEQEEARLEQLEAAASILNSAAGSDVITDKMVIAACKEKLNPQAAMKQWSESLSAKEGGVTTPKAKVTGSGSDQFASDAIDALLHRSGITAENLSSDAKALANRPLWAIAGEALSLSGAQVDMYGDRELIADEAMQMGTPTKRVQFFSGSEDSRYVSASVPFSRPGDFPNILSGLANKYLDSVELDDDFSYPEISAILPGGLNDFKPGLMMNKGVVEEMDELSDGEQLKDLGLNEEVLSYIFLRRFGNRFGWTPVMIANDDMGAFAEGMLGLAEAWQVTQNRLVLDRITGTETLLDGSALFANRTDTGTGTIPAANNNLRSSGLAPSDSEWGAMATLYAGIGGIGTGRRVRGTLNTILVPTNSVHQEAVRTFETYPVIGESKQAATTANVGLYRNKVRVVAESELNSVNATAYYGMRNPTRLNTATVVRAYFNGYGQQGRRERWYDPTNKTTYVSLEGRIAVAVKNWRYAVKNAGTGG